MYYNEEHKHMVENRGDAYEYIASYKSNEITIDGKGGKGDRSFIRVKCPYCGYKYDVSYSQFKNKNVKCTHCCNSYENSFAYHIEVELGKKIEDYWDFEENGRLEINPYLIYKSTKIIKVWIWCQDNWYHGSYDITPDKFVQGRKCPYCNPSASKKIHPLDSFGALYPEKAKYWSDKNKISPLKVFPHINKNYIFNCEKCGKETIKNMNTLSYRNTGVICEKCTGSELEQNTKEILEKYNIKYNREVKYDDLIGTRNGNLSYDFYLPDYNLLIECQGEQHEHFVKWLQKSYERFERQLEHDRRKKQYSIDHNINFLEIWYYDIDNIEQILTKQLNL